MHALKRYRKKTTRKGSSFCLGVDVGGTNTSAGVAEMRNNRPELLFTLRFRSGELDSLVPVVEEALSFAGEEYGITVSGAGVAAAGPVTAERESCRPTNLEWSISAKEITKSTGLDSVLVLNDFEAVGWGVNLLDAKKAGDVYRVSRGRDWSKAHGNPTKAVVGAGTGLGKTMLFHDKELGVYVPAPSEGGHADFPVQDEFELELADYIRKTRGVERVSFEDVLSGRGLESIYFFLRESGGFGRTKYSPIIEESSERPPIISKYRGVDGACREAFRLYSMFCGRCARNFVLEALAVGGLYIGGGIAAKNREVFNSRDFRDEFEKSGKQSSILKDTPVYVIVNHNIGVVGACFAAHNRQDFALYLRGEHG